MKAVNEGKQTRSVRKRKRDCFDNESNHLELDDPGLTMRENLGGSRLDRKRGLRSWVRYFCVRLALIVLLLPVAAALVLIPYGDRLALAGEQAGVCTGDDRKYAESIGWGDADAGYKFGRRIQEAVEARDLDSLLRLVSGELKNGPRRKFLQNKSFSEVFSNEWRKGVLSEKPDCRPVGWRGFMLGTGRVWYKEVDGRWTIITIQDFEDGEIKYEVIPSEAWIYDGKWLTRACFTHPWLSLDNYEEYSERFKVGTDFYATPGRYLGGPVPLEPIVPNWGGKLSLAVELPRCLSTPPGNVDFTDGWVRMKIPNDECVPVSRPRSCPRYRVLKRISREHCKSLAPNLSDSCIELRLVEAVDPTGGTLGADVNVGIFGIIEDQASDKTYVVPLVNFGHLNDAFNYVNTLE